MEERFCDKYGNYCIVKKQNNKLKISTDHGKTFNNTSYAQIQGLKDYTPEVFDEYSYDIYSMPNF